MTRQVLVIFALCAGYGVAGVTQVEITGRTDIPFAGYERVLGKVHFAVDPKAPVNRKLADVALAPRNAKGKVEFAADFLVYRPKDPARSNGTALVEIPNRGGVSIISAFQVNAAGRGISRQDLGDLFLFEQGFTMIWIGWQADVPPGPGKFLLYPPVLKGVTGPVRSEIIVDNRSTSESLGDRNMVPYAVASVDSLRMTVRDSGDGVRVEIPRAKWRLSADGTRIEFPSGFEPGRIYEAIYTGKDPAVASLGLAAVRDYVAHIKESGIARKGDVKRVLAYGNSQSGRFLRTFLYDGFNADEHGKKVFDGIWAHIAGAGRGAFNQRFAQPSRMAGQFNGFGNPVDLAPFSAEDLMADSSKARVAPKLLLTNGSHEYWGRAASLNHPQDREIPKDVRIYFVAGTQHISAINPNKGITQNLTNPLEWRYFQRAMLAAMNDWISHGTEPPASLVPSAVKGELVTTTSVRFPKIPGVSLPSGAYVPRLLDFGPEFVSKGIASWEPPKLGPGFATLVPQVNTDGNETSGIQLPDLRVPLATYTGWNLRSHHAGSMQGMYPLLGSMIPFPKTKAERLKAADPRLSIAERYKDQADYLKRVESAARELAQQGFLLERDVPLVVGRARERWAEVLPRSVPGQ